MTDRIINSIIPYEQLSIIVFGTNESGLLRPRIRITTCRCHLAEKADDRRSASGVVVTLGSATVSWLSSTQKIVTLSTT